MERLKLYLPSEEKCPIISFTMKLFSYLVCLILGFFMTVMSLNELCFHKDAYYRSFALWYTLSNLVWLISTFILIGPKEHYKRMLSDDLYTKSFVLICFMILSLFFGFVTSSKGVNIFLSLLQFCSILFFNYSYLITFNKKPTENVENHYLNNNNFLTN